MTTQQDRAAWERSHHCAHTDFEELAWQQHCELAEAQQALAEANEKLAAFAKQGDMLLTMKKMRAEQPAQAVEGGADEILHNWIRHAKHLDSFEANVVAELCRRAVAGKMQ